MIISCPKCSSRFFVDGSAFGPEGRKVRCGGCGHAWVQQKVEEEEAATGPDLDFEPEASQPDPQPEAQQPEEAPAVAPPAETPAPEPDPAPQPVAPIEAPVPEPAAPTAEIPPIDGPVAARAKGGGRRYAPVVLWVVFALLVSAIVAGGYRYRQELVNRWPKTTAMYEALGVAVVPPPSYSFQIVKDSVRPTWGSTEGRSTLTIRGVIQNVSTRSRPVPQVNVVLLDGARKQLRSEAVGVPRATLGPGERIEFRAQIKDASRTARHIELKLRYVPREGSAS